MEAAPTFGIIPHHENIFGRNLFSKRDTQLVHTRILVLLYRHLASLPVKYLWQYVIQHLLLTIMTYSYIPISILKTHCLMIVRVIRILQFFSPISGIEIGFWCEKSWYTILKMVTENL